MKWKENKDLCKFLLRKLCEKFLAIVFVIILPIIFVITLSWFFKISINDLFNWIFGIYSLIITIILFDSVIVNKEKEANFMNDTDQVLLLKKSLEFFNEHMLSSKDISLKIWQKNRSTFNNYLRTIEKNDKIYLAQEKELFREIDNCLLKLENEIDYQKGSVNFDVINKHLSAVCISKVESLIFEISKSEGMN